MEKRAYEALSPGLIHLWIYGNNFSFREKWYWKLIFSMYLRNQFDERQKVKAYCLYDRKETLTKIE